MAGDCPYSYRISEQAGFLKDRLAGAKTPSISRAIFLLEIEKQFPYFETKMVNQFQQDNKS